MVLRVDSIKNYAGHCPYIHKEKGLESYGDIRWELEFLTVISLAALWNLYLRVCLCLVKNPALVLVNTKSRWSYSRSSVSFYSQACWRLMFQEKIGGGERGYVARVASLPYFHSWHMKARTGCAQKHPCQDVQIYHKATMLIGT